MLWGNRLDRVDHRVGVILKRNLANPIKNAAESTRCRRRTSRKEAPPGHGRRRVLRTGLSPLLSRLILHRLNP